jgi:hypothetical protein
VASSISGERRRSTGGGLVPRRARTAAGDLRENAFQTQVLNLAAFYGWRAYHTHDSRRSQPGFPDLVLVRPPEILFVELKGARTRVQPEQREWLAMLSDVAAETRATVDAAAAAGHHTLLATEAHLWRPDDFDELHARLARGRVRQEPLYRAGVDG